MRLEVEDRSTATATERGGASAVDDAAGGEATLPRIPVQIPVQIRHAGGSPVPILRRLTYPGAPQIPTWIRASMAMTAAAEMLAWRA